MYLNIFIGDICWAHSNDIFCHENICSVIVIHYLTDKYQSGHSTRSATQFPDSNSQTENPQYIVAVPFNLDLKPYF